MSTMFSFIYLIFGFSVYLSGYVIAFERELGLLHFTCTNATNTRIEKLTVVEAKGKDDVLYYLWDFGTKPTFLIIQVPQKTEVKLNCDRFLKNETKSIEFTSKPLFMFGAMINKVYEFNDANDTATFNSSDPTIRTYNGEDFRWNISVSQNTVPIPLDAVMAVGKHANASIGGSLEIAIGAYTGDGASVDPPHILHTANGSQVDIVLNNFHTTFNQSRFAVQLILFSSVADLNFTSTEKSTPDDENTPGVFKLDTITFESKRYRNNNRGYMLWRPIVYRSDEKAVTESTRMKEYNMTNVGGKRSLFEETLLQAIYGDASAELFAKSQIVSFGSQTDKFYQKTRYSCWSFVFGTGESPDPDTNSFFFLLFFSCCVVASLVFAVLIPLKWIKLPTFGQNRSRSEGVLVDNEIS